MRRFIERCLRRPLQISRDESFRAISELDAYALAGKSKCDVSGKEENAPQGAAVCLKRMPVGYVLGISDARHELELWYTAELGAARERFAAFVERMRRFGTPFADNG